MPPQVEFKELQPPPSLAEGVNVVRAPNFTVVLPPPSDQAQQIRVAQINDLGHETLSVAITPCTAANRRARAIVDAYRKLLSMDGCSFESVAALIDIHARQSNGVQVEVSVPGRDPVVLKNLRPDRRRPFPTVSAELPVTDCLTGLPTRAALSRSSVIEGHLARVGAPLSLVLFDIRGVGVANAFSRRDTVDSFIASLPSIFSTVYGDAHLMLRYGGDEFAVAVPRDESGRGPRDWSKVERLLHELRNTLFPTSDRVVRDIEQVLQIHSKARRYWNEYVEIATGSPEVVSLGGFADHLRSRLGSSAPPGDDVGELSVALAKRENGELGLFEVKQQLMGVAPVVADLSQTPSASQLKFLLEGMGAFLGSAKALGAALVPHELVEVLMRRELSLSPSTGAGVGQQTPVDFNSIVATAREQSKALLDRVALAADPAIGSDTLRYEQVRSFPIGLFAASPGPWKVSLFDIPFFGLFNNHLDYSLADTFMGAAARELRTIEPSSLLVRPRGGSLVWLHRIDTWQNDCASIIEALQIRLRVNLSDLVALSVEHKQRLASRRDAGLQMNSCQKLGDVILRDTSICASRDDLFSEIVEKVFVE